MLKFNKAFITCCLVTSLVILPIAARAADDEITPQQETSSPEEMAVDIVLVRPLGLVSMVCGTVLFLVSSPISALGGNSPEAWDLLVAEPAKFTFQRPLGHFEDDGGN